MGVLEYFTSLSGIWWVLLILLIIMFGVYGLAIYLQRSTPKILKKIPQAFHRIQTECHRIIAEIRPYSPDDPLPYGPLVAGIHRQLDNIANQLVSTKSQYIDIQNKAHAHHFRPWQMLIGAPFFVYNWFAILGDSRLLLRQYEELDKLVELAWQDVAELKKQSWLVAMRAREIVAREKSIRRSMDDLGNQKLYGDTFEVAAIQEESVIEILELIPEYFLIAEEELLSERSTKDEVCRVHSLLNQAEPVLDELDNKLSLWTAEYQRLSAKANQVMQQMDLVENLLANKPEDIDCSDAANRIRAIHTTLDVLTATLTRLEVESFEIIDQELDRAQKLILEVGRQVRVALRQYPSLKSSITQLLGIQKECSDIFSGLMSNPQYPVKWDRSGQEFRELNKATKELNLVEKSRTPEQIKKDLSQMEVLSLRWITLQVILKEVVAQHNELVEMLNWVEIQQGLDWLQEYRSLSEEIASFHPDNWSGGDAVNNYLVDTLKTEAVHREVLSRDPTKSVSESDLPSWIAQTKQLAEDHRALRLRSEKIRTRFEWLQSEIKGVEELYQTSRTAVNQLNWIVNSNPYLKQNSEADLKRINQKLDRIGDELENTSQGKVEYKSGLVRATHDDLATSAKAWLDRLNQDIDRKRVILAGKIERLNRIAVLEDTVFEKVQNLITKEERRTEGNSIPFVTPPLQELIRELKGRSATWQELVAAQEELEEIVEKPLLDSYEHASQQRNYALTGLDRVATKIPQGRGWPPSSVSITQERDELEKLEQNWKALKNTQVRAIWAVRQYGELAASYQVLVGKLDKSYQWASQEQEKVLQLEEEIDRLLRLWQQRGKSYARDPAVLEQIRDLRARTSLAMEHLKQRWTTGLRGNDEAQEYQELVQDIMEISRFLRTTSITVHRGGEEAFDLYLDDAKLKGNQAGR